MNHLFSVHQAVVIHTNSAGIQNFSMIVGISYTKDFSKYSKLRVLA